MGTATIKDWPISIGFDWEGVVLGPFPAGYLAVDDQLRGDLRKADNSTPYPVTFTRDGLIFTLTMPAAVTAGMESGWYDMDMVIVHADTTTEPLNASIRVMVKKSTTRP